MSSSCKYDLSLLELIWRQRWSSVERRALTHSYELDLVHEGLSALHWACCNDPPVSVLKVLLQSHGRRYASQKDVDGLTPLILLLSCHDEVSYKQIQIFCQYAPESISLKDYFRRTPLHYICSKGVENQPISNLKVAALLMRIDPSMATAKNSDGETALDRLWTSCGYVDGDADDALTYFWSMVQLIVSTTAGGPTNSTMNDESLLLHHLISYPSCRVSLLDYCLSWKPELLLKVDSSTGNTPLHCAVAIGREDLVQILVRQSPSPAVLIRRVNHQNQLPIQMANHWNSACCEVLLQAHPQTICQLNLDENRHLTHLLANIQSKECLFELLRTKPCLCKR